MGSDTKIDKLGARRFDDGGWWWYSSRRGHRNEEDRNLHHVCMTLISSSEFGGI